MVPEQACVPLDPEISMISASLVGCAVMTGVGAAMYTAQIKPGETVAVFGCGGIDLNVLQGAALCGAETIVAIDTVPGKFESARTFGATHTLDGNEDVRQALLDLSDGRGVDHVLDATGNPRVQEKAIYPLRRGGTLTLVGWRLTMRGFLSIPSACTIRKPGCWAAFTAPAITTAIFQGLFDSTKPAASN